MSEQQGVKIDPLFVGLTRPTLFFGVSQSFGMVNGMGMLMGFIQTSDMRVFLLGIIIHLIGYIACNKEPLIIELFMKRLEKCSKCRNKGYHGTNSYDVY